MHDDGAEDGPVCVSCERPCIRPGKWLGWDGRTLTLIRIVAKGGNVATLASDNHPFLVWRPKREKRRITGGAVSWVRADQPRVGDCTMTPALHEPEADPFPEHDEQYWFLFGLYLAQGSLQQAGHGENRYPSFALHKKRQDLVGRIKDKWDSIGEYDANDNEGPSQGVTLMAFDAAAGAEFEKFGERHAHAKRIAPVLLGLPREKRLAVLQGWLNGDGCQVHDRRYWQGKTCSPDLAAHLTLIGAPECADVSADGPTYVLGQLPSIAVRNPVSCRAMNAASDSSGSRVLLTSSRPFALTQVVVSVFPLGVEFVSVLACVATQSRTL